LPNENLIAWDALLHETQAGQTEARESLCRELSVRLLAIAQYRLWGWPRQDQEDLVQDCLVTVLQKIDQVESNPHLYACQVLYNKIGDALRRRKIIKVPLASDSPPGEEPRGIAIDPAIHPDGDGAGFAARTEARDRMAVVQRAIKDLSVFCRTFFLGMLEERSVQEIWGLVRQVEPDLKRSAFDKRIFDCRRRLKNLVKDHIQ
jgi:DNA-directed RNA polymerase specialized sigma24 family protein